MTIAPWVISLFTLVLAVCIGGVTVACLLWASSVWVQSWWGQARRRRNQEAERVARESLVRALIGGDPDGRAATDLAALPVASQERVVIELASSIEGSQLDRLRRLAAEGGVIAQARHRLTSRRWWVRLDSVSALTALAQADEANHRLLADPHPTVRVAAVRWASRTGRVADLADRLLALLDDPDGLVRLVVKDCFVQSGQATITEVTEALATPASPRSLVGLLEVAREIHDPRLVASAASRIGDPDPEVRAAAARLLSHASTPIEGLRALLGDPVEAVRRGAIEAAAERQDLTLVGAVGRQLDSDDWQTRHAVINALGRLGAPGEVVLRSRLTADAAQEVAA